MRKIIASLLTLGIAVSAVGPALVIAVETNIDGDVSTGLTRSTGGGADPIIKVKWEMNGTLSKVLGTADEGTDDSPVAGAQFMAPGVWDTYKDIAFCAVVTDPDGVADIDGVYADWYYPANIAFHPEDPTCLDVVNGGTDALPDYGISGCGEFIHENELTKLDKLVGWDLFCDSVRNGNNNLPTFFYDTAGVLYDYDEICSETGELMKEEAYVYCADKHLYYEDPAGMYLVEIFALDKAGLFSYTGTSNPNYNYFEYLPLTAFETDFDAVAYGSVKLNTHKIISGDLTWDVMSTPPNANPASVRNIGNTRLYLKVWQDDMGLGMVDGAWNVRYDARVGNNDLDWKNYWPEQTRKLQDILDLSEIEEMDFSILITKFPSPENTYTGNMLLSASFANFRECGEACTGR